MCSQKVLDIPVRQSVLACRRSESPDAVSGSPALRGAGGGMWRSSWLRSGGGSRGVVGQGCLTFSHKQSLRWPVCTQPELPPALGSPLSHCSGHPGELLPPLPPCTFLRKPSQTPGQTLPCISPATEPHSAASLWAICPHSPCHLPCPLWCHLPRVCT